MRSRLVPAVVAVSAVALVAVDSVGARAPAADPIGDRLAVVGRTERTLVDKVESRAAQLRARVRALYKLTRSRPAPDAASTGARHRSEAIRRRAASRRILVRDLTELRILEAELASVRAARARLEAAGAADPVAMPAARSLTRPVPGAIVSSFGRYRGRRSKARLTSRGIRLETRPGADVVATHAGIVAYAGPLRGLGNVVVVTRDDGVRSVLGNLGELSVAQGAHIDAGAVVGAATGRRVYLEVRIAVGAGGLPVNPSPLLAR